MIKKSQKPEYINKINYRWIFDRKNEIYTVFLFSTYLFSFEIAKDNLFFSKKNRKYALIKVYKILKKSSYIYHSHKNWECKKK